MLGRTVSIELSLEHHLRTPEHRNTKLFEEMDLNPWIIYIVIISNLIGITCIYFYYKFFQKKSFHHDKKPTEQLLTTGHPDIGSNEKMPMMCPFMAAFKKAKKAENEKKHNELTKVAHQSEDVTKSAPTEPLFKKGFLNKVKTPEEVDSFYEHIPSHVKQLEQEKLMKMLAPEEMEEEEKVRIKQLEQIYNLMGQQSELFGIQDIDDIRDQMKLYVR